MEDDAMDRPERISGPRQVVRDALDHITPARVPVDFGGTGQTGMHVSCVAALRDYFGLEKRPVKAVEPYQMLGLIEEDLMERMGVDTFPVDIGYTMFGFRNENWKEWKTPWGQVVLVAGDFHTVTDERGDVYIFPQGDRTAPPSGKMPVSGFFFDAVIRQAPIREDELDPKDNLEEFGRLTGEDLTLWEREIEKADGRPRARVGNIGGTGFGDIALVPAVNLKRPRGIRDIEEWYVSTVTRPDYIHHVFDGQCGIAIENLEKVAPVIGDAIDVAYICGADFGTQTSTFCSEESFRRLWMPYYKRINDWIHAHTSWKTFKHCCGSIRSFIPAFIESGFDILNPVQYSAADMDPRTLKKEFGDRIVFWGGGVDTQRVLPFASPEEVRREVLHQCGIFARGGGFVFSSVHNIQAGTPVANIAAMIDAVREFNGG